MDQYAVAKQNLERLIASDAGVDRNEATTRLHLIDPLLNDCLRWPVNETRAEVAEQGRRLDYLIGRPAPRMVVEAKREDPPFAVPAGINDRVVAISTLTDSAPVASAVNQVLDYCQKRSVPIAVATTGHQLVAFLGSRQDGVPALQGSAIVFRSLQEMLDDFSSFWEYLSPGGVAEANLQRLLRRRSGSVTPPQKLSARILSYPGFRKRSELETDLKILGQLFLLDITRETEITDDFLTSCYCPSGALTQYAMVSREILSARYAGVESRLPDVVPVQGKKGTDPKLTTAILASALTRRPILILGDVGVGKSIFLTHLLRIDARAVLSGSLVLYLDFGHEPAVFDDLNGYVASRIIEQLRADYSIDLFEESFVRAVYNAEINRFTHGVTGRLRESDPKAYERREIEMLEALTADRGNHVERSLAHIDATSNRGIVLVLDNVDQRPTSFQEEVFLIGGSIASKWPATVFIAVRPQTFHARLAGSLSGYHSRAFTVYPARTDEVILRRLRFAQRQLRATSTVASLPAGLSLDASDLDAYLTVLLKAFKSDDTLKELLDNLSGGNMRVALDFLNVFVGSGYVSTRRILDVAASGHTYEIPLHEVVRAITFGDAEHYDPAQSPITNLLDIYNDDGREHFLLPSIIALATRLSEAGSDGFVTSEALYEHAMGWGYTQEQIGAQLGRAFHGRLLEAANEGSSFRATTVGLYHIRKLIEMFAYMDAIVVDTPIVDSQYRAKILDVPSVLDRAARATTFCEYLSEQWKLCEGTGLAFDWPVAEAALTANIGFASQRARLALKRPRR